MLERYRSIRETSGASHPDGRYVSCHPSLVVVLLTRGLLLLLLLLLVLLLVLLVLLLVLLLLLLLVLLLVLLSLRGG